MYELTRVLYYVVDFATATGWVVLWLTVGVLAMRASAAAEALRGLRLVAIAAILWALTDAISGIVGWTFHFFELTYVLYDVLGELMVNALYELLALGGDAVSWVLLLMTAIGSLRSARALSACCEPEAASSSA